jgi:large repetitive protein
VAIPPVKGNIGAITPTSTGGTFTYTPAAGQAGDDQFTVTLTDDEGASSQVIVPILITGSTTVGRPWIINDPPLEAAPGDDLRFSVEVVATPAAADASDLTFSLITAPSGMQITKTGNSTATVAWMVPATGVTGHQRAVVLVIDNRSAAVATQPMTILIHTSAGGSN